MYRDEIQHRELVLENGKLAYRVWRKSADVGSFSAIFEYYPKPKGGDFWDEIPFTFVGAQDNDSTIDESPLAALVEINLGRYRNSADYEDSVFLCGQAQPVISGFDTAWRDWLQDKGIRVGSRSPFLLPKEGSFTCAQAQPNILAKEVMDNKRDHSVQFGTRPIGQNGAVKTATQSNGEQTTFTSVLGIYVSDVPEAHTLALGQYARHLGIKGEEYRYSINQEFIAKAAESGMVMAIVNAWQYDAIRDTDMVRVLQRLDLIDLIDDPEIVIDAICDGVSNLTGGNSGNGE